MRIDPIEIEIQSTHGGRRRSIEIGAVAGARYASRDVTGTRRKLDELLADGKSATRTNPSTFRIGRYLLTQSDEFEVQGPLTGSEAEVVAIRQGDEILISVGSDQCDRELDPLFQDKPKQMCPHPVAHTAWPYHEVRAHWDCLELYSQLTVAGHVIPVQRSALAGSSSWSTLLAMAEVKSLPDPLFLYCGTVSFLASAATAARGLHLPEQTALGVGEVSLVRLHDPVLQRTIEHQFRAVPLGDDLLERGLGAGTAHDRF